MAQWLCLVCDQVCVDARYACSSDARMCGSDAISVVSVVGISLLINILHACMYDDDLGRGGLFRSVPASEVARDVERVNAELVTAMVDQSAVDRVFSSSAHLSTAGIKHLVLQVKHLSVFTTFSMHTASLTPIWTSDGSPLSVAFVTYLIFQSCMTLMLMW